MNNETQNRSAASNMSELDDIDIRVKKGELERYSAIAERLGLSLEQLFIQALECFISEHIDDLYDLATPSE